MLLHRFNGKTDIPVRFERAEIRLSDPGLFDMPLIYMTGHEDFHLKQSEVRNLRQYLDRGGLLVAESCCGRQGFHVAFKRELRKVIPEESLRRVPKGDFMFSVPNRLREVEVTPALAAWSGSSTMAPKLSGIRRNGHYVVLYSPYGMAGGWEMSQCPYAMGYQNTDALRLGENILLYAVTQ